METFYTKPGLGKHRNKCDKKPVKFNDRLKKPSQEHTDYYVWLVELLKRKLEQEFLIQ